MRERITAAHSDIPLDNALPTNSALADSKYPLGGKNGPENKALIEARNKKIEDIKRILFKAKPRPKDFMDSDYHQKKQHDAPNIYNIWKNDDYSTKQSRQFAEKDKKPSSENKDEQEFMALYERKGLLATALEYMVIYAISHGDFFSDPENTEFTQQNGGYFAEPIIPTVFDDITNRVDAALFLHIPIDDKQQYIQHTYLEKCYPIAFDATTTTDKSIIREKILVGTNVAMQGYHPGFTEIRFCRDVNKNRSLQTLVSRYNVGVNEKAINEFIDGLITTDGSAELDLDEESAAMTRFKLTYEVYRQNKLYLSPLQLLLNLDDDLYYNLTDDQRAILGRQQGCAYRLQEINKICKLELKRIIHSLPLELLQSIDPDDEGMIEQAAAVFQDPQSAYYDDTFAAIIETTHSVYKDYLNYPDSIEPFKPYKLFQLAREERKIDTKDPNKYERRFHQENDFLPPKMLASLEFSQTQPS